MVHRDVTTGGEGAYNVIDWRSWKLARVSRSTLAAESQAAGEASDALLFATTFWRLIWSPWLPLDDIKTAQLPNEPKLVVDAKALFDLLVQKEIQAGSSTDKRTAIEGLVTQDNLRCCGASSMWVGSELQYSDGLTKGSAAQLLANKLRSHLTRLKSDEDFVASKKKSAAERKKGAEKYAIKKSTFSTATTMFAAFCTTAVQAVPYEMNETYDQEMNTINIQNTNDSEYELTTTIMAMLFGILVLAGLISTCRWLAAMPRQLGHSLANLWKVTSLEEAKALETKDADTQTEDDLMDHLNNLQYENLRLGDELELTRRQVRELEESYDNLATILRDQNHDRRRMIIEAGQQQIYFTAEGRVWHASYQCLRNRTSGQILHRTWCTHCLDRLGQYPDNQAPPGETTSRLR